MQSKNGFRLQDTTMDKVREILRRFPETRNSDAYLTWLFLKKHEGLRLPFLEFKRFHDLKLETIRRARQKIQRNGEYLPTNLIVLKERGKEGLNRSRGLAGFN